MATQEKVIYSFCFSKIIFKQANLFIEPVMMPLKIKPPVVISIIDAPKTGFLQRGISESGD